MLCTKGPLAERAAVPSTGRGRTVTGRAAAGGFRHVGRQPLVRPWWPKGHLIDVIVNGAGHERCEGNNSPHTGGRHCRGPPTPAVDGAAVQHQAVPSQAGERGLHPGIRQARLAARHPDALGPILGAVLQWGEAGEGQIQLYGQSQVVWREYPNWGGAGVNRKGRESGRTYDTVFVP